MTHRRHSRRRCGAPFFVKKGYKVGLGGEGLGGLVGVALRACVFDGSSHSCRLGGQQSGCGGVGCVEDESGWGEVTLNDLAVRRRDGGLRFEPVSIGLNLFELGES